MKYPLSKSGLKKLQKLFFITVILEFTGSFE